MFALILAGALGVALLDPSSVRSAKLSDVAAIALASLLAYGTMRIFVWLAVRPFGERLPKVVRAWGLIWFYGAIPLTLVGLYVGSIKLHAPTPSAATVAFVVAVATSIGAGAFTAVKVTTGRLTTASSARVNDKVPSTRVDARGTHAER